MLGPCPNRLLAYRTHTEFRSAQGFANIESEPYLPHLFSRHDGIAPPTSGGVYTGCDWAATMGMANSVLTTSRSLEVIKC